MDRIGSGTTPIVSPPASKQPHDLGPGLAPTPGIAAAITPFVDRGVAFSRPPALGPPGFEQAGGTSLDAAPRPEAPTRGRALSRRSMQGSEHAASPPPPIAPASSSAAGPPPPPMPAAGLAGNDGSGLRPLKLAAMADASLADRWGERWRGPHVSAAASAPTQPRAPAEASARLVGLLYVAREASAEPVVSTCAAQALDSYLAAPTDLVALVDVGERCRQLLCAGGLNSLAAEVAQTITAALRDPAPTLRQCIAAIEEFSLTTSPGVAASLALWRDDIAAALSQSPSFAAHPAQSMRAASESIAGCLRKVESARAAFASGREAIERRSNTLRHKSVALASLADTAAQKKQLGSLDAINKARWRMDDALARLAVFESWTRSLRLPLGMVAYGSDVEKVVNRAVAIEELLRYAKKFSAEERQALSAALIDHRSDPAAYASLPNGQNVHRHAQGLTADDHGQLAALTAGGGSFLEALQEMSTKFAAPSSALIAEGDKEAWRAQVRQEMARAPLEAKQMLEKADILAPLADRLAGLAAHLAPTLAQRNDALHARAFETLLAEHLIEQCPHSTMATWTSMGDAMAAYLRDAKTWGAAGMRQLVARHLRKLLKARGQRPWDAEQPAMQQLVRAAGSKKISSDALLEQAEALVGAPALSGFDVVGKVNLLRDLWLALALNGNSEGVFGVAPVQERANTDYARVLKPRKDRAPNLNRPTAGISSHAFGANAPRAATGVMGLHQPLPSRQQALAATQPGLTDLVHITSAGTRAALQQGAVVVSGVSGSTNILLHLFEWAQRHHRALHEHHARDIAMGAVQFLVHDGGHSVQEVLWVFEHSLRGKYKMAQANLPAHGLAQMRALFAHDPAVQLAFERSATALGRFDRELQEAVASRAP